MAHLHMNTNLQNSIGSFITTWMCVGAGSWSSTQPLPCIMAIGQLAPFSSLSNLIKGRSFERKDKVST